MTANDLGAFVPHSRRGPTEVLVHCTQSTMLTADTGARGQPYSTRRNTSVRRRPVTKVCNTSRSLLPSSGTCDRLRTLVDAQTRKVRCRRNGANTAQSFGSATAPDRRAKHLNFKPALLIPYASLLTVSRTVNFLFKVLFIFPSRFLFAIGLVPIFSFRRSLPPILGCITKQPDSQKTHRERCTVPRTGLSPSTMCRSKQLKYCAFALKTNL